ncbi:MAG: GTPase ObgE [Patescibacteria group bacterium]
MLIDETRITIKAGNGGDGLAHLYHDAQRPKGGPDGGKGGDGGSVFFKAVSDIGRLSQFRFKRIFEAENGDPGGVNQKSGKNGRDLVIEVPIGSVINYDNGTGVELTQVGQTYLAAQGGKGGWGNYHFRSATNQTPKEFKIGFKTATRNIFIQLKLIADVGLIGLPNAGKTSLLNELTSANAKVANYAFTTLEPNLGVMKNGKIMADIPGLIEGAADGKGLGYKFLKHIERTQILIHCLSAESSSPKTDYQVIRQELKNYNSVLIEKPEILILTKSDLLSPFQIKKITKLLPVKLAVSIIDDSSLKKLNDLITLSLSSSSPNPS